MSVAKPSNPSLLSKSSTFKPWIIGFLLLLLLICVWGPLTLRQIEAGLDASWIATLAEAKSHNWRFGQDLVFTGGPLSFIYNQYYIKDEFTIYIIISALFILVLFVFIFDMIKSSRYSPAIIIAFSAALLCFGLRDPLLLLIPIAAAYFLLGEPRDSRRLAFGVVCIAASALASIAKFSVFPASIFSFLICDLVYLKSRRVFFSTPLFLLTVYVAFYLTATPGSDFSSFVIGSWETASAYTPAMSSETRGETANIADFLLYFPMVLVFLALAARNMRRGVREEGAGWARASFALIIVFYIWYCFKQGFVRHDAGHVMTAFVGACFGILMLNLVNQNAAQSRFYTQISLAVVITVISGFTNLTRFREIILHPGEGKLREQLISGPLEIFKLASFIVDPRQFVARLDADRRSSILAASKTSPVSSLDGSVDIIDSRQSSVIAAGLDYTPRPTIQEYTTYSRTLIALNRKYFESARAPDYLLIKPGSLDNRLPSSAEGSLWPSLLMRYKPVRIAGDDLLMRRRPDPLPPLLKPVSEIPVKWGETIAIPQSMILFATLDIQPTILGRVADIVFKSPAVSMICTMTNGTVQKYRLIPGQAQGGFFLTPIISTAEALQALASGEKVENAEEITSVSFESLEANLFFHDRMLLTLQQLDTGKLK